MNQTYPLTSIVLVFIFFSPYLAESLHLEDLAFEYDLERLIGNETAISEYLSTIVVDEESHQRLISKCSETLILPNTSRSPLSDEDLASLDEAWITCLKTEIDMNATRIDTTKLLDQVQELRKDLRDTYQVLQQTRIDSQSSTNEAKQSREQAQFFQGLSIVLGGVSIGLVIYPKIKRKHAKAKI